jgi:hypothetical protein
LYFFPLSPCLCYYFCHRLVFLNLQCTSTWSFFLLPTSIVWSWSFKFPSHLFPPSTMGSKEWKCGSFKVPFECTKIMMFQGVKTLQKFVARNWVCVLFLICKQWLARCALWLFYYFVHRGPSKMAWLWMLDGLRLIMV